MTLLSPLYDPPLIFGSTGGSDNCEEITHDECARLEGPEIADDVLLVGSGRGDLVNGHRDEYCWPVESGFGVLASPAHTTLVSTSSGQPLSDGINQGQPTLMCFKRIFGSFLL